MIKRFKCQLDPAGRLAPLLNWASRVTVVNRPLPTDFPQSMVKASQQIKPDNFITLGKVIFLATENQNDLATASNIGKGLIKQPPTSNAAHFGWQIFKVTIVSNVVPCGSDAANQDGAK